jgi:hypothetical protein
MVLLPNAIDQICIQLEQIAKGEKVSAFTIGHLLPHQVELLNTFRSSLGLSHVGSELVFVGRHIHKSRIIEDGYEIADVRAQLESALSISANVQVRRGTILQSAVYRDDGYGNNVRDEAVLELSSKNPRVEVFSVIPRGDKSRPPKQKPLG